MPTKKTHCLTTLLLPGCFALVLATTLNATVLYQYSGPNFTDYSGADTIATQTHITASFTIESPLGPNYGSTVLPESWEVSDGYLTLTPANATFDPGLAIATNALGQITFWVLGAVIITPGDTSLQPYTFITSDPVYSGYDRSLSCSGGTSGDTCISVVGLSQVQFTPNYYSSDALTTLWTVTDETPEPRYLLTLPISLTALVLIHRRRANPISSAVHQTHPPFRA